MTQAEKISNAAVDWYKLHMEFQTRMAQSDPSFKSEKEYVKALKRLQRSWDTFIDTVENAQ